MSRYSALSLLRQALPGAKPWPALWRDPEPKPGYDAIVVGGGGHGLATAYYLARNHGLTNVAVLERGWIGGGNAGRNTTIIRSNYMIEGNTGFYDHSLRLWHELSHELNFNVMFSPRGQLMLSFSPGQTDALRRRYNIMRLNGIDGEWLDRAALRRLIPHLNFAAEARYPIEGAFLQRRAGTARHDAVVWGYARAADRLGVDIIQNCEVIDFIHRNGACVGVATTRGEIRAERTGLALAGSTSTLAEKAGLGRLPIESHKLQAFVSEPIKPFLDHVVSAAIGGTLFYISQSDKGGLVFGGMLDGHNSYAQRGALPIWREVAGACAEVLPAAGRVRLLRQWAGVMDMSMDGSPIIGATQVPGLFLNAGWCYGGFKATPASGWCFAHAMATGESHPLAAKLTLDRFATGAVLDETGGGAVPNHH